MKREVDCNDSIEIHGSTMAIIVFFLWLAAVLIVSIGSMSKWSLVASGQYGDSFGVLSCLFSGLAVACAYAAFKSQQYEIRQTRDQQRRDVFRDSFHALLAHWKEAIARIELDGTEPDLVGRYITRRRSAVDALIYAENQFLGSISQLQKWFQAELRNEVSPIPGDFVGKRRDLNTSKTGAKILELSTLKGEFMKFHEVEIGGQLGHVFRIVRELLQCTAEASTTHGFEEMEVFELSRSLKALMSDPELHLLLYWGLSERSTSTFFHQIDRLFLLEGLVDKHPSIVQLRIPELAYYPETYKRWRLRHPFSRIDGADDLQAIYFEHENPITGTN